MSIDNLTRNGNTSPNRSHSQLHANPRLLAHNKRAIHRFHPKQHNKHNNRAAIPKHNGDLRLFPRLSGTSHHQSSPDNAASLGHSRHTSISLLIRSRAISIALIDACQSRPSRVYSSRNCPLITTLSCLLC